MIVCIPCHCENKTYNNIFFLLDFWITRRNSVKDLIIFPNKNRCLFSKMFKI